jgi:hypothetical protein
LRFLGVNATGAKLWLCLVGDDGVMTTEPGWLELHEGHQAGYAMTAFREECAQALTALAPDRVVILEMETSGRVPKVADMRNRFTAETILTSCAIDAEMTCVRLARATVRSRLCLPRAGALASHVTSVFETPIGKYWTNKRDLAALAAQAEVAEE